MWHIQASPYQNLFAHERENDGACTSEQSIGIDKATESRRESSAPKSLSRFVHPEVPSKATGQFPPLFTDAAIIRKVMTDTSLGRSDLGAHHALFVLLSVVF